MAGEIDELVEVVRTLAHGLVPPVLDELGLVPAIVDLADRHRISGGLDLVVTADDVVVDVAVEQAVYGIVAEAVRNAVRHADASSCEITFRESGRRARRHAWKTTVSACPQHVISGVGLLSMRERADGIGADAERHRVPTPGTLVELRVPGLVNGERVLR